MQRLILAAWLLLAAAAAWPHAAWAQGARDAQCRQDDDAAARKLLRLTLHQLPANIAPIAPAAGVDDPAKPPDAVPLPTRIPQRRTMRDSTAGLSGNSVRVVITLDGADPPSWTRVRLRAAARTRDYVDRAPSAAGAAEGGNDLCLYRFAGVYAQLRAHDGRSGSVEVDYPSRVGAAIQEAWSLVIALHDVDTDALFAYGTIDVEVGSLAWSAGVSIGLLLLIYGLLVAVAIRINGRRLRLAEAARFAEEPAPPSWRIRTALNPIFLTQDASGIGSLARLQLLVFTLAVAFVCTYVFLRTGELASLSVDTLKLLGIAIVGSALARVGGETGAITPANRIWLKGKGLIISDDARLPRASDLVCADGELQIARVQAIIFSSLTVAALLWTGPRDLGGFKISEELLYLLGLSQLAYVAGRALPAEGIRRLNQEVAALRAAERQLSQASAKLAALASLGTPAAPEEASSRAAEMARLTEEAHTARTAWNSALAAAEDSLLDVYGEMLDRDRLAALRA